MTLMASTQSSATRHTANKLYVMGLWEEKVMKRKEVQIVLMGQLGKKHLVFLPMPSCALNKVCSTFCLFLIKHRVDLSSS